MASIFSKIISGEIPCYKVSDTEDFLAFLDMLLLDLPKRAAARPPMLVIGGEKDTVCLPSEQQSLADYYGVACHIIEDAPHNLMSQTKWQEAADKLAEWVETRA